jgi:hypothetical protein
MHFRDLQSLPSMLASFLSADICESEEKRLIPEGVRTDAVRTRTDGPRFDLRRLMPTPA